MLASQWHMRLDSCRHGYRQVLKNQLGYRQDFCNRNNFPTCEAEAVRRCFCNELPAHEPTAGSYRVLSHGAFHSWSDCLCITLSAGEHATLAALPSRYHVVIVEESNISVTFLQIHECLNQTRS